MKLAFAFLAGLLLGGLLVAQAEGHAPTVYTPVPQTALATFPASGSGQDSQTVAGSATAGDTPAPSRTPVSSRRLVGPRYEVTLTWYCLAGRSRCTRGHPGGHYAAASPDLLDAGWRGQTVRVCSGGRCTFVVVIDCDCSAVRSLDLYSLPFSELAPLSRGRIHGTAEVVR